MQLRIGIDIRATQASNVCHRGIGVYTKAVVEQVMELASDIQFLLLYDPSLPPSTLADNETQNGCKQKFVPLPLELQARDRPLDSTLSILHSTAFDCLVLEHNLSLIHFTSPTEPVGPLGRRITSCPYVVTLYDLMPLIFDVQYLWSTGENRRKNYLDKLGLVSRATGILTISEASRQDAIRLLGIPPDRLKVAYSGVDEQFTPPSSDSHQKLVKEKYNIQKPYVFAVTGTHYAKNPSALFAAFSLLPPDLRHQYQLVVLITLSDVEQSLILDLAHRHRVADNLVLVNDLTRPELIALYQGATLLVHLSRYEGFGLPVAEAMRCGVPVVAGNNSSLPEVGGKAAWLVDSDNPEEPAQALATLLTHPIERQRRRKLGLKHVQKFSWESAAQHTLQLYRRVAQTSPLTLSRTFPKTKLRVACWTPIRPAKTGIADYFEELLPHLAQFVDVDIYTDIEPENQVLLNEFSIFHYRYYPAIAAKKPYDIMLFQMGNSTHHQFIYEAALIYPGVIDLHEINLHGFMMHRTLGQGNREDYLSFVEAEAGPDARRETAQQLAAGGIDPGFIAQHPLTKGLLDRCLGTITHNQWARQTIENQKTGLHTRCIPLGAAGEEISPATQQAIREILSVEQDSLLVGMFGLVNPHKRPRVVLSAFARLLQVIPEAVLVIVGETKYYDVPNVIAETNLPQSAVRLLGHTSLAFMLAVMQTVDIAVNLRYPSLGESSAILARLLAIGKAVLVSDVPSFQDIPDSCCWKVPVDGQEEDVLVAYLLELARQSELRQAIGNNARSYMRETANWGLVARAYADFLAQITAAKAGENERKSI